MKPDAHFNKKKGIGRDTLDELCKEHWKPLFGYVGYLIPIFPYINFHEAEDIVQEVFIKALEKISQFRGKTPGSFRSWLKKIAYRHMIDLQRARIKTVTVSFDPQVHLNSTDVVPSPEEEVFRKEIRQKVKRVLEKLNPKYKEVLIYRVVKNPPLSVEETAKAMGISTGYVKKLTHYALKELAKEYFSNEG